MHLETVRIATGVLTLVGAIVALASIWLACAALGYDGPDDVGEFVVQFFMPFIALAMVGCWRITHSAWMAADSWEARFIPRLALANVIIIALTVLIVWLPELKAFWHN